MRPRGGEVTLVIVRLPNGVAGRRRASMRQVAASYGCASFLPRFYTSPGVPGTDAGALRPAAVGRRRYAAAIIAVMM